MNFSHPVDSVLTYISDRSTEVSIDKISKDLNIDIDHVKTYVKVLLDAGEIVKFKLGVCCLSHYVEMKKRISEQGDIRMNDGVREAQRPKRVTLKDLVKRSERSTTPG